MATGKAAGPSCIVAEMLRKVAWSRCVISLRKSPQRDISQLTDWRASVHRLHNGKEYALNRGNFRGRSGRGA